MKDDGKVPAIGSGKDDIFLTINGMKIAKRENDQWTSLVPGYKVRDYGDMDGISVEVDRTPYTPHADGQPLTSLTGGCTPKYVR